MLGGVNEPSFKPGFELIALSRREDVGPLVWRWRAPEEEEMEGVVGGGAEEEQPCAAAELPPVLPFPQGQVRTRPIGSRSRHRVSR